MVKEHYNKPLEENDRLAIMEKIKKYVGLRQEILTKSGKKNEKLLKSVLVSFWQLTRFDPERKGHYRFYQGETLFAKRKVCSGAQVLPQGY